jgi:hypothetical protein
VGRRARVAGLTGSRDYPGENALRGAVEVGVIEDDVGTFAAEFKCGADQSGRDGLSNRSPGGGRPGEGDLVDARVFDEGCAGDAGTGHDVHDAGRETRIQRQLDEADRGHRRHLGGLDDDRVPGGQCAEQLPLKKAERIVPWSDRCDDSDGNALRPGGVPGHDRSDCFAVEGERIVGAEFRSLRQGGRNQTHLRDRLAVLVHLQSGELGSVVADELSPSSEQLQPRERRRRGPCGERGSRCGHGTVDVSGAGDRNVPPFDVLERVDAAIRLTVGRRDALPVDDHRVVLFRVELGETGGDPLFCNRHRSASLRPGFTLYPM